MIPRAGTSRDIKRQEDSPSRTSLIGRILKVIFKSNSILTESQWANLIPFTIHCDDALKERRRIAWHRQRIALSGKYYIKYRTDQHGVYKMNAHCVSSNP